MLTIRKEKLYWFCQIGGWFTFIMLELITYLTLDGFRLGLLINASVNFLLGLGLTHFYRSILIRAGWLSLPIYKLIPRGIFAVIVISIIMTSVNIPLDRYTYPIYQQIPITWALIFGYFFNLSKYVLLWALTYHLFRYWEQLIEVDKERYRLEAAMKENEYHNLKTQLNPHFLFNSLNSIRSLIDINPALSKTAIEQLSGLLRSSLYTGQNKTISLNDEIKTVKDYLAIETIRFDERLQTVFDIKPDTLELKVPPMMLQTLVENAVKHGISGLKSGGVVHIQTYKENNYLIIEIRNTGYYQPNPMKQGIGLRNTIDRLRILYGDKARFSINNQEGNQVLTKIEIPA